MKSHSKLDKHVGKPSPGAYEKLPVALTLSSPKLQTLLTVMTYEPATAVLTNGRLKLTNAIMFCLAPYDYKVSKLLDNTVDVIIGVNSALYLAAAFEMKLSRVKSPDKYKQLATVYSKVSDVFIRMLK